MDLQVSFCEILWNYWHFIARVLPALIGLKWDSQERQHIEVMKFPGLVSVWGPDSDSASFHMLFFLTTALWPLVFTYFTPLHPSCVDSSTTSLRNTSLASHSRVIRVYNLKFGIGILLIKIINMIRVAARLFLFTILLPEPKTILNKYVLNEWTNELKNGSESWIHYF